MSDADLLGRIAAAALAYRSAENTWANAWGKSGRCVMDELETKLQAAQRILDELIEAARERKLI